MIKTVSFAPPRAPRAAKSAVSRAASSPVPAKSSPAKAQSPNAQSAQTAKTPVTLDVSEVRAALQKSAAPAKKPRASKNAPAVKVAAESATVPAEVAAPAEKAEMLAAKVIETKAAPVAKRSRVPKDLAAQYGGAPATEDAPRHVVEVSAPRKRLTRAKKEARSQLLRADDDVLQRLQQANAIEAKKPASRGRGWEFECGCCGRVTRFQTPAALCQCGAIAVKE